LSSATNTIFNPPTSSAALPARKKVKIDPGIKDLEKKLASQLTMREFLTKRDSIVYPAALGHGGEYRVIQPVVSSQNVIESDHAPNYSTLDYLENVKNLPDTLKKAVEARRTLTNELAATNYDANVAEIKRIDQSIKDLEAKTYLGKFDNFYTHLKVGLLILIMQKSRIVGTFKFCFCFKNISNFV